MRTSIPIALLLASCAAPIDVGANQQALVICPGPTTVEGIDVSEYQGTIDWDAVAAGGVEFAFIRVSNGTGHMDTRFAANWPQARRVGLLRGVYQYFRAADDPIEQADLLIDAIGGALQPGDLPPVLDVENGSVTGQSAAVVIANMHAWLDYVEAALGVRPIVYSAFYFWRDVLGNPDFTAYPLWVANYGVTCPNVPVPWGEFRFWQYTAMGSVAGISVVVDRDIWNGDMAGLLAFAVGDPVCGDGVCNATETPVSCASDCPVCASIPALGRVLDESEVCFARFGNPTGWHEETVGWNSSSLWTNATAAAMPQNYGVWSLTFDQGGRYRLEAHTPAPFGASQQAIYEVRHAGLSDVTIVDQNAVDGWNPMGQYEFAAGSDQFVRLDDNTGEPLSSSTELVYDAIRVIRIGPPSDDGGIVDIDAGTVDSGTDAGRRGGGLTSSCGCRAPGSRHDHSVWVIGLALCITLRTSRRRRGARFLRPRA